MANGQLKTLIPDIAAQRLVLPQFQRDFVWPPAAIIKLLVSLFNGYPIGSLLLMENNDNYDFRAIDGVPGDCKPSPQEVLLVLDGQQRLTACYRAFVGTLGNYKHSGRYYFDYAKFVKAVKSGGEDVDGSSLEDFFVFLKPQKVMKHYDTTAHETAHGLFPLDVIFGEPRGSNYADWLSRYNFAVSKGEPAEFETLTRISSRFIANYIEQVTGYQVNYDKITRDTKPDVICTVFETINTTGIKLTVFDLLVAKSFKQGIRLRDQLEEAVTKFEHIRYFDPDGHNIASIHLPRIIGLLHNVQCKKGDLLQMPISAIENHWTSAVVALDRILGIMRNDFGCLKLKFVPSIDVISPLAVIVGDMQFAREAHFAKLKQLYWNLVFSLYLSGAPETKSSRIVREWRENSQDLPESALEAVRSFAFNVDELDSSTKNSVVYKGVMSLLIANGVRDLGVKRVVLKELKSHDDVDDHHIYPQQFLRQCGIKGGLANSILNRTPLRANTNQKIGSDAPPVYITNAEIVGTEELTADLEKHAICEAMLLANFSNTAFQHFRDDRKTRLIEMISTATGYKIESDTDATA